MIWIVVVLNIKKWTEVLIFECFRYKKFGPYCSDRFRLTTYVVKTLTKVPIKDCFWHTSCIRFNFEHSFGDKWVLFLDLQWSFESIQLTANSRRGNIQNGNFLCWFWNWIQIARISDALNQSMPIKIFCGRVENRFCGLD